jgi:hypothetical protein
VTGGEYADRVASYVSRRFAARGVRVYREVSAGKSIIGKNRRLDILCVSEEPNDAFAIECKYQEVAGTVDEKIPYTLDDLRALPMRGCVAYAGTGFSAGVLQMLRASEYAAYCLPADGQSDSSAATEELDHLLAMHFRWWDVLVAGKTPVSTTHRKDD